MRTYAARYRKGSSIHDYSYTNTNFAALDMAQASSVAIVFGARHGIELVGIALKDA